MAGEGASGQGPRSSDVPVKHSEARRRLLKSLAAGGVVAGAHVVPDRWIKPVVDVVVVPAHAQASAPSMTAQLTLAVGDGSETVGPGTTTVDPIFPSVSPFTITALATLVNPPVPGQNVTLSLALANTDAVLGADGGVEPTNPTADFGPITVDNDADASDTPASADLTDATLTATFSSAGVPDVVITVTFA
jgi:hypothetical protein